jgi:hypothetical protein
MKVKFKNIISLLLLLVFLLPSIVKLEHHHQHNFFQPQNVKQFRVYQDKCEICSFEFSVFLSAIENIELQNDLPVDHYSNHYKSLSICNLSQYSFALRAPPYRQI